MSYAATPDSVVEFSRESIRHGSKSFSAAARLFDERTRSSAYMLYAWCRYCDDLIDGQASGHYDEGPAGEAKARERLIRLHEQTQQALSGAPVDDPVFVALQRVVQENEIPARYPLEVLEGFAMDVVGTPCLELDDTLRYSYHVAGVVGIMMAYVMGVREDKVLDRACDLGLAFQLTNISRDVIEDAEHGRIYLPADWLEKSGVPAGHLLERQHRNAVSNVVRDLLVEADRYYESAARGIPALPFRCAWAIATARRVYGHIGRLVLRRGESAWDTRTVVGRRKKVYFGLRGLLSAGRAISARRSFPLTPREDRLWKRPISQQTPLLRDLTAA